jgi:NodT family efflux transporter outer membrane factor (OMF) lipoprotein
MARAGAVLLAVMTAGCTVGPDYQEPTLDVPAQYAALSDAPGGDVELAQWWRAFGDPALDDLVADALAANDDLAIARARLREARALSGAARTGWLPDASVSTGHSYRRQSLTGPEATAAGVGSRIPESDFDRDSDYYDATFDASWEADLFGRVRRSVEAADAEVQARVEDLRSVRVSLLGEIATAYVRLREQQARIALNERLLDSQRKTLELTRTLHDNGAGSLLDVKRSEGLVSSTEAILPTLRARQTEMAARLSVLTAQPIAEVLDSVSVKDSVPVLPLEMEAAAAPADLLRRRPDLRSAEQSLRAAVARTGVAEADLYPRFTLSGSLGWTVTSLGDVSADDSLTGAFGPRVSWAFLNIPEVRRRIEASDARAQAALSQYQKTLRQAVAEVETAFAAYREEQFRSASLEASAGSYRTARDLSRQRYEAGAQSYLDLLDLERQLLAAENELVVSKAARTIDAISVYKALGGGWQPDQPATTIAFERADKQAEDEQKQFTR